MTDAQPAQPRTDRPHLEVLDGVRGLAILLVMQFHFYGFTFGILDQKPTLTVDRWTARIVGTGWSGVDLFFVLSGFLITGILYDAKHSSQGYFRIFYARRILRIFPLYYGFLIFVLFVLPYLRPFDGPATIGQLRDNQVWYWTYMVNVASAFKGFHAEIPAAHGQFWSLAVEEQFYLFWPLAVLLLARRNLMVLCAALIVVAFGIRVALAEYVTTSEIGYNASHVLLPTRRSRRSP